MIPINLSEQLLSGTFEFTLNELMDKQIDLSSFDQWYNNEKRGPKAFHPAVMLKIILYAYSKGILSSRKIEHACKTNIIFMALSGEATPDHSTIAAFLNILRLTAANYHPMQRKNIPGHLMNIRRKYKSLKKE
jgi:transposase